MKFKNRFLRFVAALSIAGLISSQIPVTGVSALAQDGYDTSEEEGSFLGLGVSGQDVVRAGVAALAAYGLVVAILDQKNDDQGEDNIESPGPDTGTTPSTMTFDAFSSDPDYSSLAEAANAAGLKETLNNQAEKITVFAPTNTALQPVLQANDLLNKPTELAALIQYHMVDGDWSQDQLTQSAIASNDNFQLTTRYNNQTLTISATGGLKVNGVPIVKSTRTGNGWIHGINSVLPGAPLPDGGTVGAATETITPPPTETPTTPPATP